MGSLIHVVFGCLQSPIALQPYRLRQTSAVCERLRELHVVAVAVAGEMQRAAAELVEEGHVLLAGAYHGIDNRLRVCRGPAHLILRYSCRFVQSMLKGGGHAFACFHAIVGCTPDRSRSVRSSLPCVFDTSSLFASRHNLLLRRINTLSVGPNAWTGRRLHRNLYPNCGSRKAIESEHLKARPGLVSRRIPQGPHVPPR